MSVLPPVFSAQYSYINMLLKHDEEDAHMIEFTRRLTMLLVTGPHEKKFAEDAMDTISRWYWGVVNKDTQKDNEQSDSEAKSEATSVLSSLKF